MSAEDFIAYQWYLAGAFLAFVFAVCTLFFQALFHEKRIALAWLGVMVLISLLNGSGVVSLQMMGTGDNRFISGIQGIGDYLVLALGLVELGLFLLFVARHYRKVYVSVPALVIVLCVGFGYQAYQDLVATGNVQFGQDTAVESGVAD